MFLLLYQLNYKVMHMYKNVTVRPKSVVQGVHYTLPYTLNTEVAKSPILSVLYLSRTRF